MGVDLFRNVASFLDCGGVLVCPGSAFGCEPSVSSLPDSIMVGRTGPIPCDFFAPDLAARGELACSIRFSFRTGGVGAVSSFAVRGGDWRLTPARSTTAGLFNRSAAIAPAARICSSVGAADEEVFACVWAFFPLTCSGSGALGFVSRATITSCARICPATTQPQSRPMKASLAIIASLIDECRVLRKLSVSWRQLAGRAIWITGRGNRSRNSSPR